VTDNRAGNPDGVDTLIGIENLQFGAQSIGLIAGTNAINAVNGGAGKDLLLGFDGNDTLAGGAGADILIGGAGADTFDFNAVADSGIGVAARDLIADFVSGIDKLDFSTIDARVGGVGSAGNNAFVFNDLAGAAITDRGQLVYHYEGSGANEITVIQGNVSGNLNPDFEVALTGHVVFNQAADLVL
jgi:Ca2+-binding RTX toxin-like protein